MEYEILKAKSGATAAIEEGKRDTKKKETYAIV